jgi:hypothetical protein
MALYNFRSVLRRNQRRCDSCRFGDEEEFSGVAEPDLITYSSDSIHLPTNTPQRLVYVRRWLSLLNLIVFSFSQSLTETTQSSTANQPIRRERSSTTRDSS